MMLNAFLAALAGILVIVGVVSAATKKQVHSFPYRDLPFKMQNRRFLHKRRFCGFFPVFIISSFFFASVTSA